MIDKVTRMIQTWFGYIETSNIDGLSFRLYTKGGGGVLINDRETLTKIRDALDEILEGEE